MGKFESATSYGEAVIRFWHDWRKVKSKDKKKAKREKMRSEKAKIQGKFLTPNTPLIQHWCAQSK